MNKWLSLILSLPTENATARMRAWRALKMSGAVVLRDGVYLMPERDSCSSTLKAIAADIRSGGGTAILVRIEEPEDVEFAGLFNRRNDYATLLAEVANIRIELSSETAQDVLKQIRKLRKAFAGLVEIDFFPGEAQRQADTVLRELELTATRVLFPDEPHAVEGTIERLSISNYQGRVWATRKRPWVDRLACSWLIRRFIDKESRFLWLESPNDCPVVALGFDFDGATFSHVHGRVTFEVLLESFGLEQAALKRIGALVHYLDVGGVQPPEAAGIESVLAGLREAITDDEQLVATASGVFDGLHTTFDKGVS